MSTTTVAIAGKVILNFYEKHIAKIIFSTVGLGVSALLNVLAFGLWLQKRRIHPQNPDPENVPHQDLPANQDANEGAAAQPNSPAPESEDGFVSPNFFSKEN